jgi:hypothetical protein
LACFDPQWPDLNYTLAHFAEPDLFLRRICFAYVAQTTDRWRLEAHPTCMDMFDETLDLAKCLRKEMEYYAKADASSDNGLKSAHEAAAREYHHRAILLKSANTP